jgi:signal transduction histidine kinase
MPGSAGFAMNAELYQVPTLALLTALVAVFGALWLEGLTQAPLVGQSRDGPPARRRQMFWLAGWICAVIRLATQVAGWTSPGWGLAISEATMELAPLMFLASLAPQYFVLKPRVQYVVAFGLPVMAYSAMIGLDPQPGPVARTAILGCMLLAIGVAVRWSLHRQFLPVWLSVLVVGLVGGAAMWLALRGNYWQVGALIHSGVMLMTALMFLSAFRRPTAGLVFTVGGMTLWSLPALVEPLLRMHGLPPELERPLNLVKVITAVGMIVLVLEGEIASNQASQHRDRRTRLELERYSALYLAETPFDENGGHYNQACETIAEMSRFAQAAIFVQSVEGVFQLAGRAGMSGALAGALDALARRTTEQMTMVVASGKYFTQVAGSLTLMDLSPLMEPGDELAQMNFRRAHVMGIRTRGGQLQGALLLAALRNPEVPVVTEDVLPLEMLVARLGAAREHAGLVRRLMQSERLAGLGQLASGVAHELNNPLQAVTGFAQLLVEGDDPLSQEHAAVILAEARRMKQIIESLMRFRNAASASRVPVAVELLLRDIEKLMRHDLENARIVLELHIPEHLPRVKADGEQIRQVFLQVMKNAMTSLEEAADGVERRMSVEVAAIPKAVEVMFSDTGRGFAEPGRAFDPFFTTRHPGEGLGLGLSICYAIVREHGGEISAVNLHPRGAAVVIELPAYVDEAEQAVGTAVRGRTASGSTS